MNFRLQNRFFLDIDGNFVAVHSCVQLFGTKTNNNYKNYICILTIPYLGMNWNKNVLKTLFTASLGTSLP